MLDKFKSFLSKYAGEALGLADALASIASGIALPKAEAEKVQAVIAQLEKASESILGSIPSIKAVKISKSDIEAAVAATLPAILKDEVSKAVIAALAANAAEDAANEEG